jgi:ribosome recycling factor
MISASQLNETTNLKNFEGEITKLFFPLIAFLEKELGKIRASRAHPSLIEDIKVLTYGGRQVSALKQIALISAPEATILLIQPFDISTSSDIEKALSQSDIGLNPKNDGSTIKIVLPPMSRERRAELGKQVTKKKEEAIIQMRKVRQDVLNEIKKAEKNKQISQDLSLKLQKSLQNTFDKTSDNIEILCKKKEQALQE